MIRVYMTTFKRKYMAFVVHRFEDGIAENKPNTCVSPFFACVVLKSRFVAVSSLVASEFTTSVSIMAAASEQLVVHRLHIYKIVQVYLFDYRYSECSWKLFI